MNKELINKAHNFKQRKARIKKSLVNPSGLPRLTVTISNRHISAQLIDDSKSTTLLAGSSVGKKSSTSLTEKAVKVGEEIATAAKSKKIEAVVFDRNGRKYHGRIKAFADSARSKGLKF
jgi:large subunit ribosomal protein L18